MKKLLFTLCLFTGLIAAQTRVTPDCVIPFVFTASGQVTGNNTCGAPNGAPNQVGIASWILVYYNEGFTPISIVVQSAPDNAGVPGAWATFAGTVLTSAQYPGSSGINPNTAVTSAFTGFAGYYPWMRVSLTATGSGVVKGALMGFLNSSLARAGSGSGGGATIAGTANEITVTGAGCSGAGTCTISIPNNPIFPGNASATGTVTSGVGSGTTGALDMVGSTSGNTSTVTVDATNTATTVSLPNDATSGLYITTSRTPTPAAGCAQYNGTGTEAASTGTPCGSSGGSAGGGVLGFSASTVTLPTAGTTFLAPIGGAAASTTEATVSANAPAAAAISHMYVSLSAVPGAGNTIAFTFRDAGSPTALTCTVTAAATTCNDITHSFTPTVGDALSIQVVTTGTVVITPTIRIIAEYGVTGGGGVSYKFQYFPAGQAGTQTGYAGTGTFSSGNTLTLPAGGSTGSFGALGETEFRSSGDDGIILTQLPTTWDGSNIVLIIDAAYPDNNTGNASFQAYSACVAIGSSHQPPTWSASGANVANAAQGNQNNGQWTLSVPVTGCVAGNFVYIDFRRPSTDSYTSALFTLGVNVGIKY